MSDELRKRFEDHAPDDDENSEVDQTQNTDNTNNAQNTNDMNNTQNMDDADNPSNTGKVDKTGSTPGPDKDPNATRNRTMVPMYLDDDRKERLNDLYDRLDGRSKVAGEGGIEKHADFMTAVADLALDSEDELADRIGIPDET